MSDVFGEDLLLDYTIVRLPCGISKYTGNLRHGFNTDYPLDGKVRLVGKVASKVVRRKLVGRNQ